MTRLRTGSPAKNATANPASTSSARQVLCKLNGPLEAKDVTNTINYVTAATYAPQGVLSGFTNQATIQARFTYNPRLQPLQIFYGTNGIPSAVGDGVHVAVVPCAPGENRTVGA